MEDGKSLNEAFGPLRQVLENLDHRSYQLNVNIERLKSVNREDQKKIYEMIVSPYFYVMMNTGGYKEWEISSKIRREAPLEIYGLRGEKAATVMGVLDVIELKDDKMIDSLVEIYIDDRVNHKKRFVISAMA